MATPATIWIRGAGAQGAKDGTSLADAYGLDPGAADDGWSAINLLGALTQDLEVRVCGSGSITTGITITQLATREFRAVVRGRNSEDTDDAETTIDAGGGAFSVMSLSAPYWSLHHIYATNTDQAVLSDGITMSATADKCVLYQCRASAAYIGINASIGSANNIFIECRSHDNANIGFVLQNNSTATGCVSHSNGVHGFSGGQIDRCISYGNTADGFGSPMYALQSSAHGNGTNGFTAGSTSVINASAFSCCIAVNNTGYGFGATDAQSAAYLIRCADFGNGSGRAETGVGTWILDTGDPSLGVSPFVDAGSGNFNLNNQPTGGKLCRNLTGVSLPGGLTTTYTAIGAAQPRQSPPNQIAGGQVS